MRDGPVHSDHHTSAVEDLGDILWYVADTATWLGVDLGAVAEANLSKIADRWPRHSIPRPPTVEPATAPSAVSAVDQGIGPAHLFDGAHQPAGERLPRTLTVQIAPSPYVAKADLPPRVLPVSDGKPCGNVLGDNAYDDDGYRYHDAFHLAYLAVLGWSPVQRALLGRNGRPLR